MLSSLVLQGKKCHCGGRTSSAWICFGSSFVFCQIQLRSWQLHGIEDIIQGDQINMLTPADVSLQMLLLFDFPSLPVRAARWGGYDQAKVDEGRPSVLRMGTSQDLKSLRAPGVGNCLSSPLMACPYPRGFCRPSESAVMAIRIGDQGLPQTFRAVICEYFVSQWRRIAILV